MERRKGRAKGAGEKKERIYSLLLTVLLYVLLFPLAAPSMAADESVPKADNLAAASHEASHFPPSRYPLLAERAKKESCMVCHLNPQLLASLEVPAPVPSTRQLQDYGYRGAFLLPSTRLCMSCHDGSMETAEGAESMARGNLREYSHQRNHPVEVNYDDFVRRFPSKYNPREGMTGMKFEELSGSGRDDLISCLTCHDPHKPTSTRSFLRWKEEESGKFCQKCHRL